MSTPIPPVAGATVVSLGVDTTGAEAVSGDGAIAGASSGAPMPPPGIVSRSSAGTGLVSCGARAPSVAMGVSLFIGNCITDAEHPQKLCRYNNLQNYSAPHRTRR